MSYAGDGTLRKRLETGALPRDEALRIFVQAARGVQALHERSLVHFDLKPANIFLKGDIARVGDYGLSKLITESRNSLSFGRGTPYYMAPEMLQRRGDSRSDVYSLGVVLYECLTGDVPFKGDTEWEVLRKHENQAPLYPDHVDAADRSITDRCLAKNPDDRFQTAEELLRALHAPAALGESMVITPARQRAAAAATVVAPASAGSAPAPPAREEARHSPYGMPWKPAAGEGGILGAVVHGVFRAVELAIVVVLAPVRLLSMSLGQGLVFLLQLPFRILALALQLAGYLLMAAVLLLVIMGLFFLGSLVVA
jgi:serine/threonine-protein kinase